MGTLIRAGGAEPDAVGFYERIGGKRIGEAAGSWGETLPVMRIDLE